MASSNGSTTPVALTDATGHGEEVTGALTLLSQQIWCWGRDIERSEGNWLMECGFECIPAPEDDEYAANHYELSLPKGQTIVLRGFGVFFGDPRHGGIFLPRYEFTPMFTPLSTLDRPLFSADDLPDLTRPNADQRSGCLSMLSDALAWIVEYERTVVDRLGLGYREQTLLTWDNGERTVIPADAIVPSWEALADKAGRFVA